MLNLAIITHPTVQGWAPNSDFFLGGGGRDKGAVDPINLSPHHSWPCTDLHVPYLESVYIIIYGSSYSTQVSLHA